MNFIQSLGTQTFRYFKGLFAIALLWLLPALGIFIFDSCKKANYDNSKSGEAARKFIEAVDATRPTLGSITLGNNNAFQSRVTEGTGDYYLDFPDATSPEVITGFSSNVTVQTLRDVLTNHGVSIDDSVSPNADLTIQVPEEPIRTVLQPLVVEAQNYLFTKGITSQQITDMLIEEGAEEIDLIPFVKILSGIEQEQYAVRNIQFPLLNGANAGNFLECGLHALGADAFFALAQSSATVWTWSAMKTAFKSVAKRMLGPIGVAVAVIDFAYCML